MTETGWTPSYTLGEEIANALIHGLGAVLAVGGLVVLIVFASVYGDAWTIVGCTVFGVTLTLLYSISTLYHCAQPSRVKAMLRLLDHSFIFLLIAGTYTPFALVNLRGPWGWSLFGVSWSLAVLGIALRVTVLHRGMAIQILLYVVMGWTVLVAAKPMLAAIATGGVALLLMGGVAYTGGIVFYLWQRLPYNHAVWHVFVLLGSTLHYFAILLYVIPVG